MKTIEEILERVKKHEKLMDEASKELAEGHSNDAPNWSYWSRNFDKKTAEAEKSLLQDLQVIVKEHKISEISDLARKSAIAALEKMKEEEDRGADNAASCDGPNAGWHWKTAKENKKVIDDFISMLGAKSYESIKTLVLDAIIKESVKASMQR